MIVRFLFLAGLIFFPGMAMACEEHHAMGETVVEEDAQAMPMGRNDIPLNLVCTEEAKICPDGSAVGRQAPDCAFAPCPGKGPAVPVGVGEPHCTQDVMRCSDGTEMGRGGPDCAFMPCPEKDTGPVCSQDLKHCPNGITVGRIPPFCNFTPCPEVRM